MMYDRRKADYRRYDDVSFLILGFCLYTLRVLLKVLEIWFHLQKIFTEEALVAKTSWACLKK